MRQADVTKWSFSSRFQYIMNCFATALVNTFYLFLLVFYSPVLFYRALRQGKYRRGFREKWFGRVPRRPRLPVSPPYPPPAADTPIPKQKRIWFHAVSVGEVNLLRPLLERIRQRHPEWECVISTTSNTGMDLARQLFGRRYGVFFCPLDFTWSVRKAFSRLNPDLLVLVEQELWPNLIDTANKQGVKVVIINGRFSEKGYRRYRKFRWFVRAMLRKIDCIAVQSETYAGWFHQLGASSESIRVVGSIKFDGADFDRTNQGTTWLRSLAGIAEDDVVFLAGSTQEPEEAFAVECYERLKHEFPKLRLILVPRHPERFGVVARMLSEKGVLWRRRSRLDATAPEQVTEKEDALPNGRCESVLAESNDQAALAGNIEVRPRILLVDTIGELGAWWGTSHIAFVGGSIHRRGGQNMIEPAAYGAAVCFGPNTKNFRDIVSLLLRDDAAVVVHDQREMEQFVHRCLEEPEYARSLGRNAKTLVERQLGATQRTLELLERVLETGAG